MSNGGGRGDSGLGLVPIIMAVVLAAVAFAGGYLLAPRNSVPPPVLGPGPGAPPQIVDPAKMAAAMRDSLIPEMIKAQRSNKAISEDKLNDLKKYWEEYVGKLQAKIDEGMKQYEEKLAKQDANAEEDRKSLESLILALGDSMKTLQTAQAAQAAKAKDKPDAEPDPPPLPPPPPPALTQGAANDDTASNLFKAWAAAWAAAACAMQPELCPLVGLLANVLDLGLFDGDPEMVGSYTQVVRDLVAGNTPDPSAVAKLIKGLPNHPDAKAIAPLLDLYDKLPENRKGAAADAIKGVVEALQQAEPKAAQDVRAAMEKDEAPDKVVALLGGEGDQRFFASEPEKMYVHAACSTPGKGWVGKYWTGKLEKVPVRGGSQ